MRLGIKARVGIRALFDLAFHGAGRQVQAQEMAARQAVPIRTLSQVLQDLRKAGLVEARRGPRGGYALGRAPGAITMAAVLDALGEPVDLFRTFDDGPLPRRGRPARPRRSPPRGDRDDVPDIDIAALVWAAVADRALAALKAATLAEFVSGAEAAGLQRASDDPLMYFI